MKKKLLSIVAICFVIISIFTFSGCAVYLKGGPAKTDVVTGNGSMTVRKGDYLYFVNGYVSNTTLKGEDNNYGNAKNGAIYRAKLDNGKLIYDVETVDDEEIKTLTNVELLVPKVAGFEYSSLFIYEDTLYFTSPNTEKDKSGKIRFDLTDVFAVSIKGGKPAKVANAINLTSKDNLSICKIGDYVYVTYISNGTLYNVKVKGTKVSSTFKVDGSITSFAGSEDGNVCYTRNIKEGENNLTGNVLAKLDLQANAEVILYRDNYNSYSVKDVINGKVYYTKTNALFTNAYIYSRNLDNFVESTEKQYTAVSYSSNQYIFDSIEGNENGVLVNENNKLLYLTGIENPQTNIKSLYEGTFTLLGNYRGFVYGKDTSGNIIRINPRTEEMQTLLSSETEINLDMNVNFDYDNGYIYYYVKYTGEGENVGYYLNRTYINQSEFESELVGVVDSIHQA